MAVSTPTQGSAGTREPIVRGKGSHDIILTGTLEHDVKMLDTKSREGGEKAAIRLKVVEPGRTWLNNGVEQSTAEKTHYFSATLVGDQIEQVRGMKGPLRDEKGELVLDAAGNAVRPQGELLKIGGIVEGQVDRETGKPVMYIRAFEAERNVTPDDLANPNRVHLAGKVLESRFQANRGNPKLDSITYKMQTFGNERNRTVVPVKEFGEKARELHESGERATGKALDLDGKFSHNPRYNDFSISTTPAQVRDITRAPGLPGQPGQPQERTNGNMTREDGAQRPAQANGLSPEDAALAARDAATAAERANARELLPEEVRGKGFSGTIEGADEKHVFQRLDESKELVKHDRDVFKSVPEVGSRSNVEYWPNGRSADATTLPPRDTGMERDDTGRGGLTD